MPRYFFHIRDQSNWLEDFEGDELEDLDAARNNGREVARELLLHRIRGSRKIGLCQIEIADEAGTVLDRVPVPSLVEELL
jgi:hypothetical protein